MGGRSSPTIAFYIPSFERGGVERLIINLSGELINRGINVEVLIHESDPSINQLPGDVTVVELGTLPLLSDAIHTILPPHVSNAVVSLPAYIRHLRRQRPDLVISMQTSPFAVLGAKLARTDTTVAVRESNTPSAATAAPNHLVGRLAPLAKRLAYPRADHVIAVSRDAADDIEDHVRVPREKITVIYNPTYNESIVELAQEPVDHTWFDEDVPIVTSVGRFSDQKDFQTLLRAFERVRTDREARLVLVGDGENRDELEALAADLGIDDSVAFVGYQQNPYKFMAGADVFVLSSHYEGLPNVLIEALGVGTPAIATDCPSGPREIFLDGDGGDLVPVGDADAMANAIERNITDRSRALAKLANGRGALDRFTPEHAADSYIGLIENC